MTSTIKTDALTTKSDNTDLTITGHGSGVPNIEAGFKVGGSAGVPTASIQDDAITSAKIADDAVVTAAIADDAITLATMASGVDGVIITYDASGNPVHVGPGSDGQVLTSTGAGSPPAFEAAASGPDQASQAEIEGQTNVDKYIPPDLLKYGPSSCKVWAYVSRGGGTPVLGGPSYNMTSVTDDGDSQTIITIATDFSSVTYSPAAVMVANSTSFAYVHTLAAGSFKVKVSNDAGGSEDTRDFACQAFGDQ